MFILIYHIAFYNHLIILLKNNKIYGNMNVKTLHLIFPIFLKFHYNKCMYYANFYFNNFASRMSITYTIGVSNLDRNYNDFINDHI